MENTKMESMENKDVAFAKSLLTQVGSKVEGLLKAPYETKWKPDNTPVTDIDIFVTKEVTDMLRQNYPDDSIYGEEESLTLGKSGFTWVLDPIDGTQALGMLPTSTICLARVNSEGSPIFSAVYNPITSELFYSEKGGSYLNGEKISVSKKDTIKSSYIFLGSRMPEGFATNGKIYDTLENLGAKILNTRSLAYSCLLVALGKAEGAYIGVSTPFEAASVKLIVENAGGKVSDLNGGIPLRFDGQINGLIVSNGNDSIHNQLVSSVKK